MNSQDVYFWCDLETTGLDPSSCEITEIAAILTRGPGQGFEGITRSSSLICADGALWQRGALDLAEESGLLADLDEGSPPTISSVEHHLSQKIARFDRVFLAARNVAFERGFLEAHMPDLAEHLHYRAFDVTPLCQIDPTLYDYEHGVEGTPHRAMYDIERDLAYAREFVRRYGSEGTQ